MGAASWPKLTCSVYNYLSAYPLIPVPGVLRTVRMQGKKSVEEEHVNGQQTQHLLDG